MLSLGEVEKRLAYAEAHDYVKVRGVVSEIGSAYEALSTARDLYLENERLEGRVRELIEALKPFERLVVGNLILAALANREGKGVQL